MPAIPKLAAACALVLVSVLAIDWVWNIVAALAILAACGLVAGLAWPRPSALLVPVVAAVVAGVIDVTSGKASWGPTRAEFMVLWVISSVPGVICGLAAIVYRRRHPRSSILEAHHEDT